MIEGCRPQLGTLGRRSAYEVLGMTADATDTELRQAFRRLMAASHPDRGGTSADAILLNSAMHVLSTDRRAYDAYLAKRLRSKGRREPDVAVDFDIDQWADDEDAGDDAPEAGWHPDGDPWDTAPRMDGPTADVPAPDADPERDEAPDQDDAGQWPPTYTEPTLRRRWPSPYAVAFYSFVALICTLLVVLNPSAA